MTRHRTGPLRSEEARDAVLNATTRLFAERGYDHLTMEAIAAEAGVGKATLYRWWHSKGEIIAECLLEGSLGTGRFEIPDTGGLRSDLRRWLTDVLALAQLAEGEVLLRSLVAAAAENAAVGRRLRDSITGGSALTERFARGVSAGDLGPQTPIDELSEALAGALVIRALSRESSDEASIERLLDLFVPARPAPESS